MYKLSNSSLSQLSECERCFYMDRRLKIPRPQGIKSSMPTAVDGILKTGFDLIRGQLNETLAALPELEGFVLMQDQAFLKKLRHWMSNPLQLVDSWGNLVHGAFDDMLHNPTTGQYAMLDYKTTGKPATQEFGERYYQKQVDIYTAMIEAGKLPAAGFGVLLFFWPEDAGNGTVRFTTKAFVVKANPKAAWELFEKAIAVLAKPEIPKAGEKCEWCQNHTAKQNIYDQQSVDAKR